MPVRPLLVVALVALAGCAHATLPYTPDQQPAGKRISASYQTFGDRLRVEIDTDGQRLEQAWIIKADGTTVAAIAVENPTTAYGASSGSSIGIGIGGGTWGGGGGIGSGLSVGIPVGSPSSRTTGNTFVSFPLAQAGPAPWPVYVKLAGLPATTIRVGGPPPAR